MGRNVVRIYDTSWFRINHPRFDESFQDSDLNPAMTLIYNTFMRNPRKYSDDPGITDFSELIEDEDESLRGSVVYHGEMIELGLQGSAGGGLLGYAHDKPDPNPLHIEFRGKTLPGVESLLGIFETFSLNYHTPSLVAAVNPVRKKRDRIRNQLEKPVLSFESCLLDVSLSKFSMFF